MGRVLLRSTGKSHDARTVTVVLKHGQHNDMPFYILTAYTNI
ncbi:RNase A-like domain-containing protein [Cupriavidus campinensis]